MEKHLKRTARKTNKSQNQYIHRYFNSKKKNRDVSDLISKAGAMQQM
jgi:hypothetical protein